MLYEVITEIISFIAEFHMCVVSIIDIFYCSAKTIAGINSCSDTKISVINTAVFLTEMNYRSYAYVKIRNSCFTFKILCAGGICSK